MPAGRSFSQSSSCTPPDHCDAVAFAVSHTCDHMEERASNWSARRPIHVVASLSFYSYLARETHPTISIPMRSHEFKSELPPCHGVNNKVVV